MLGSEPRPCTVRSRAWWLWFAVPGKKWPWKIVAEKNSASVLTGSSSERTSGPTSGETTPSSRKVLLAARTLRAEGLAGNFAGKELGLRAGCRASDLRPRSPGLWRRASPLRLRSGQARAWTAGATVSTRIVLEPGASLTEPRTSAWFGRGPRSAVLSLKPWATSSLFLPSWERAWAWPLAWPGAWPRSWVEGELRSEGEHSRAGCCSRARPRCSLRVE
jgi:hypothetical protein